MQYGRLSSNCCILLAYPKGIEEEEIRSNESKVTSTNQNLAFVQAPCSVQTYRKIDKLTSELVGELINRIDVYSADRIEIHFKYGNELMSVPEE